jgi:hypothetical protein
MLTPNKRFKLIILITLMSSAAGIRDDNSQHSKNIKVNNKIKGEFHASNE